MVLLFAMFVGGSAGSTGGGVKVIRWLVVLKAARRELYRTTKPDVVQPIRLGGEVVDEDGVRGIMGFTLLYLVLMGVGAVFLAVDGGRVGLDVTALEALSASLGPSATSARASARWGRTAASSASPRRRSS